MSLKDKNVIVTGGSRGLGLGLVESLVAHGANVTVVARDADALASVSIRLGVATISADITDQNAAHRILAEARPDILALNAGTKPRSEEHTSELQSHLNLVCRLLLEKKKKAIRNRIINAAGRGLEHNRVRHQRGGCAMVSDYVAGARSRTRREGSVPPQDDRPHTRTL